MMPLPNNPTGWWGFNPVAAEHANTTSKDEKDETIKVLVSILVKLTQVNEATNEELSRIVEGGWDDSLCEKMMRETMANGYEKIDGILNDVVTIDD